MEAESDPKGEALQNSEWGRNWSSVSLQRNGLDDGLTVSIIV